MVKKAMTIDKLAGMIKRNFDGVDKHFDGIDKHFDRVDKRLGHVDNRLDHLDARMGRMEADLKEIKGNIVYKFEFEDLAARVKYLEAKLGIQSGK